MLLYWKLFAWIIVSWSGEIEEKNDSQNEKLNTDAFFLQNSPKTTKKALSLWIWKNTNIGRQLDQVPNCKSFMLTVVTVTKWREMGALCLGEPTFHGNILSLRNIHGSND